MDMADPKKDKEVERLIVKGDMIVEGNLISTVNVFQSSSSSKKSKPSIVTSLPSYESPPLFFTGRSKALQALHNLLEKSGRESFPTKRITVITGLGGIGKTSLASKYAADYGPTHYQDNVAWFNADNESTMIHNFIDLIDHFGICGHISKKYREDDLPPAEVKALVKKVYRHFAYHVKVGLFIFDNAHQMRTTTGEDSFGILDFVCSEKLEAYPIILVTSRHKLWGMPGHEIPMINLTSFSTQESVELLRKIFNLPAATDKSVGAATHSNNGDPEDPTIESLEKLCETLGNYPLALNLAASTIASRMNLKDGAYWFRLKEAMTSLRLEIEKYQKLFSTQGEEWMSSQFPPESDERYDKIMATVWTQTVGQIQDQFGSLGKMAVEILNLISYLPNFHITVKFVYFIYHTRLTLPSHATCFKVSQLEDIKMAFGLLEKFSMLSLDRHSKYELKDITPSFFGRQPRYILSGFIFEEGSGRIRIHNLVQKSTALKLQGRPEEAVALGRLADFCKKNYYHEHYQDLTFLEDRLRQAAWPPPTHHHYLWFSQQKDYIGDTMGMLRELYRHFSKRMIMMSDQNCEELMATRSEVSKYFSACKLSLIYTYNCDRSDSSYFITHDMGEELKTDELFDDFSEYEGDFEDNSDEEEMDENSIQPDRITFKSFIDLTFDHLDHHNHPMMAETGECDQLFHDIMGRILVSLTRSDSLEEYLSFHDTSQEEKLRTWIRDYLSSSGVEGVGHSFSRYNETFYEYLENCIVLARKLSAFKVFEEVQVIIQIMEQQLIDVAEWEFPDFHCWEFFVRWIQWLGDDYEGQFGGCFLAQVLVQDIMLESKVLHLLSQGLKSMSVNIDPEGSFPDILTSLLDIVQILAEQDKIRKVILSHEQFMSVLIRLVNAMIALGIEEHDDKYFDTATHDQGFRWQISSIVTGFAIFAGAVDDDTTKNVSEVHPFLEAVATFSDKFISNRNIQWSLRKRIDLCYSVETETRYKEICERFLQSHPHHKHQSGWRLAQHLAQNLKNCDQQRNILLTLLPNSATLPIWINRAAFTNSLEASTTMASATITTDNDLELDPRSSRVTIVVGPQGIGKTMAVLQYAKTYHCRRNKNVSLWINAVSEDTLTNSFFKIARRIGVDHEPCHATDGVYDYFADRSVNKFLFIFDNAPNTENDFKIKKYLPPPNFHSFHTILILPDHSDDTQVWTNMLSDWDIQVVHLDPMNLDESLQLLTSLLSIENNDTTTTTNQKSISPPLLKKVSELLCGYPTALTMTASSILQATHNVVLNAVTVAASGGGNDEVNSLKFDLVLEKEIEKWIFDFQKTTHEFQSMSPNFQSMDESTRILTILWKLRMNLIFRFEPVWAGQKSLDILHIAAFIPDTNLTVKWCHFIHNNISTARPILDNFRVTQTLETLSCFQILVKYGFLLLPKDEMSVNKLGDFEEIEGGSSLETVSDFFFGDRSGKVHLDGKIRKWIQLTFHHDTRSPPGNQGFKQLVMFYEHNFNNYASTLWPYSDDYMVHFEESKWASGIYNHFIYSAYNLGKDKEIERRRFGLSLLKKLAAHLINSCQDDDLDLNGYVQLCKLCVLNLALVQAADQGDIDNLTTSMKEHVDHSTFLITFGLDHDDCMFQMSFEEIHNWVLEQVIKFEEMALVQEIGTRVLDIIFNLKSHKPWFHNEGDSSMKTSMVQWTRRLFNVILAEQSIVGSSSLFSAFYKTFIPFVLFETFRMPAGEVIGMIVKTSSLEYKKSFMIKGPGDTLSCFFWGFFFRKIKVLEVWNSWIEDNPRASTTEYARHALQVKNTFLEQEGLHLLQKYCVRAKNKSWSFSCYDFLDMNETVQELACTEVMRRMIVRCSEFMTDFTFMLNELVLHKKVSVDNTQFQQQLDVLAFGILSTCALLITDTNQEYSHEEKHVRSLLIDFMELADDTWDLFTNHYNFDYKDEWCFLKDNSAIRGKQILEQFLQCSDIFKTVKVTSVALKLLDCWKHIADDTDQLDIFY